MSRDLNSTWNKQAKKVLLGKRIIQVKYVEKKECDKYMWTKRPISFMISDDEDNITRLIVQSDDEGNNGGALWYSNKNEASILPVLELDD
tara:strand:- start:709 stop:978 length:270 start_codon:yes stop_codon:yes gene_type:complete